jgi:hypothetical protein
MYIKECNMDDRRFVTITPRPKPPTPVPPLPPKPPTPIIREPLAVQLILAGTGASTVLTSGSLIEFDTTLLDVGAEITLDSTPITPVADKPVLTYADGVFRIQQRGIYQFQFLLSVEETSTTTTTVFLEKNNANYLTAMATTEPGYVTIDAVLELKFGDSISFEITGGTWTTQAASPQASVVIVRI